MNLNWLQSLIYGLVSGLTEFLPLSPQAHQRLLMCLFGASQRDPVRDLLVHLSVLLAIFFGCSELLTQFRKETTPHAQQYRSRHAAHSSFVSRLVRMAVFPLTIGMIILSYINNGDASLLSVAVLSVINGIVLYIPNRMLQGNKDASAMSLVDSWAIGIAGAFSVFSGISRIGCMVSTALMRGADRNKALNWALILSVPSIIVMSFVDLFGIFFSAGGINFWSNFFGYLLSAIASFGGAYASIILVRLLTARINYSWFAYYSWGFGLFSFILYLTVV